MLYNNQNNRSLSVSKNLSPGESKEFKGNNKYYVPVQPKIVYNVVPYTVQPKEQMINSPTTNQSYTKISIKDSIQDTDLIVLQRQRIQQLQERIDSLTNEYSRLADKCNEITNENKRLHYESQQQSKEKESFKRENLNLDQSIIQNESRVQKVMKEMNEEMQKNKESLMEKTKEIEIWKDNYDKAEQQFVFQVKNAGENICELEQEIQKLHALYKQEKQQRQYNETQCQTLVQEKNSFKLVIEDLEVQVKGLERSYSKNNSVTFQDIAYYENEIASLRIQVRESHECINYEKQKLEQYNMNMNGKMNELNFYKSKFQEYENMGAIMRDQQEKIQFLQQENNRLNEIMVGRCRDMMNNNWK